MSKHLATSARLGLPAVLALVLILLAAAPAPAAERRPLLLEGKRSLFQRAVSHPGAVLRAGASAEARALEEPVKPFTVFYLYGRQGDWVEVGPSTAGPSGWIDRRRLTDWPQAMTLIFTERTSREPVLFFKDEAGLRALAAAADLPGRLRELRAALAGADQGRLPPDLPVLAAEPDDRQGAVARERFYLMPILQMSQPLEGAKFLKVASIDPALDQDEAPGEPETGRAEEPPRMRTAIALVIDTTISMQPYIEQCRELLRQAFDALEKEGLSESLAFGVVAFRNDPAARPGLEYRARVISDFQTAARRDNVEEALAQVREARASSHSFAEDALAGVKEAVDGLSWDEYPSRLLILISDAGPLGGEDPHSGTRMDVPEILDYARARNIWLTALHIKSPAGLRDHASAEKAYRRLSRLADHSAAYIPIPAPDPEEGAASFARAAGALTDSLSAVVRQARAERESPKPPPPAPRTQDPTEEARRIGQAIGYAMRLDFLGQARGNRAPRVVQAWISDMDLGLLAGRRYSPAVEVAVLLTKNQLSDLQTQLKIIIDQAERTKKTDSRDFFRGILSASAQLSRDPAAFSRRPGRNLQEMGVLGEFLEGLPYKSDVMLLEEEDWFRMSVGEQTAFINRLRSRIARYEEYDKDLSNWESFGAADPGDWVYRVPLSMLP